MKKARLQLLTGLFAALAVAVAMLAWSGGPTRAMPPSVFRVTITNLTDPPTSLSPGALVAHCADGAFWSEGALANAELEQIATHGNPAAAVALDQEETAMGMTFLQERYEIGAVGPGESVSVDVVFEFGCKLSTAQQLIDSEDSFLGASSVGMWDPDTHLPLESVSGDLMVYDAGRITDGEQTAEPIVASGIWTGPQGQLTIEFLDPFEDTTETAVEASASSDTATMPNAGSGGLAAHSAGPPLSGYAIYGLVAIVFSLTAWSIRMRRLRRVR